MKRMMLPCKAYGQEPENRYREPGEGCEKGDVRGDNINLLGHRFFLSSGTEERRRTKMTM